MTVPLLEVQDAHVSFPVRRGLLRPPDRLQAVRGVSLSVDAGETVGIVGESGCGKSTLARAMLGLTPLQSGRVMWSGRDITGAGERALAPLRRRAQLIFQDPLASLDPRMTLAESVAEPLRTHFPSLSSRERMQRIKRAFDSVGLDIGMGARYPHEVSGGQGQRAGIARAMITEPELIVCDEPTAALDVSIKAQIINLLKDVQRRTGIALVFISHDLAVVRQIAERVMILYLGRVAEEGPRGAIFDTPMHPYTRNLLAAVPSPDPRIARRRERSDALAGELPSAIRPPSGCPYRTRCSRAEDLCRTSTPSLEPKTGNAQHAAACHFPILDGEKQPVTSGAGMP